MGPWKNYKKIEWKQNKKSTSEKVAHNTYSGPQYVHPRYSPKIVLTCPHNYIFRLRVKYFPKTTIRLRSVGLPRFPHTGRSINMAVISISEFIGLLLLYVRIALHSGNLFLLLPHQNHDRNYGYAPSKAERKTLVDFHMYARFGRGIHI